MAVTKQQVLDYHFGERPGKIEVTQSKPCRTQRDLSLGLHARGRSPVPRDSEESA